MAITLENYHRASTDDLESAADSLGELVNACDYDEIDSPVIVSAYTLLDAIESELDAREMEESLPAHDDTPSLADEGIELGSYAS